MKKIIISIVVCFMMLAGICSSAFSETIEGPGYSSSIEAAFAYGEFFSRGDIEGMLSTFSVESYVENYNTEFSIELRNYNFPLLLTQSFQLPDESQYLHQLNILKRQSDIISILVQQCIILANGHDSIGSNIKNKEQYEIYKSNFHNRSWPGDGKQSDIIAYNAEDFFTAAGNADLYKEFLAYKEKLNYDERNLPRYGCDEFDFMIVFGTINEDFFMQFLTGARYGDRWYILDARADLLETFLGLDPMTGEGLYSLFDIAYATDWTFAAITDYLKR